MAEHGLPFSDNFAKGTPTRFFAKMLIFVLVPRNLIMGGVRLDSILSPFWKSSSRLRNVQEKTGIFSCHGFDL